METIASACLVASGVPIEQAALAGKSLGGVTKGFSLSEDNATDTILSSLEKSIIAALDSDSFELSEDCRELLKTDVLSPKRIIKFMCKSDSNKSLKERIIQICMQDPNCDISTFPLDEFVVTLTEKFEEEILNNHKLASYACYCMLRNGTSSSVVHLANQQYVKSFEEPLFLHKNTNDSHVNLKNLFVLQKYQSFHNNYDKIQKTHGSVQKSLQDAIADFIQEAKTPFLFIEGDAGSGKTTLVAWMNYHYYLEDEIAVQLFGNRPLLTIRLRDLDKKDIEKKSSLSSAICKYMNLDSLDMLERLFPKAVMLLDGFDELCMIEGLGFRHEMLLYDLHKRELNGFQFIVTTRPKFISPGINFPSEFISLQHFDSEQREIWLDHYTSEKYCAQTIDNKVYAYIKNIDEDTSSCICDTPMTLYMLAAKKNTSAFLENSWALYHHIFFEELSETEYNKMFPDPNRKYFHDISRLRDVLYQVSEEIAYHMYQKGNQSFCLSDHEVSKIVERLSSQIHILKHANMQDITERCYALCCYWKAYSNRGAVEFLHNNIRDFFLAEKVYREMDDITRTAKNENYTLELYCEQVAQKLSSLFQHGVLETKVCEFIYLRALYNAEKKNLILQSMNIRSRQSQPSLPVCPETIFTKIYWQKTPI